MKLFWRRMGKVKKLQRSVLVVQMVGDGFNHRSPKLRCKRTSVCDFPDAEGALPWRKRTKVFLKCYYSKTLEAFLKIEDWPLTPPVLSLCLESLQYDIVTVVIETLKEIFLDWSDSREMRLSDFLTQIKLKAQITLQLQWLGLLLVQAISWFRSLLH